MVAQGGFEATTLHFGRASSRSRALPFSGEKLSRAKSSPARTWWSTSRVSWTAPSRRFLGLAVGRETSHVCVHPEKERERMKCSLTDSEGLSAQIGNLGNL